MIILKKIIPILLIVTILGLVGCTNKSAIVYDEIDIFSDVFTNKSRYNPNDIVEVTVGLYNSTDEIQSGDVKVELLFISTEVLSSEPLIVSVGPGERKTISFDIVAPADDYKGYILKATFLKENQEVDIISSAVDISSDWSKFPRYGYLVNYEQKSDISINLLLLDLNKYHINGLQFYDWQNKHHIPLPLDDNGNPLSLWPELSKRLVSFNTVQSYIDIGHQYNIMSMNYNLLFGTFNNPQSDGVDLAWGMYIDSNGNNIDYHGLPSSWETSKILLMDPSNTHWQEYIFEKEKIVFDNLAFDGWHVDQLGHRGDRYDVNGNKILMVTSYLDFLKNAKNYLDARLVFNAVDGYAQEDLAKSSEVDFLYQEVWSESKYSDLKRIIDYGFIKSNYEKSMILAAYMNYGSRQQDGVFNTSSVLLTDATIFASGGAHLELGDAGMLSSEYFPSNNLKMSSDLKSKLRDYYDFLVAYQNLLRDNIKNTIVKTEIIGVESSTFGTGDSVWTFGKENNDYLMIHLINLLGNDNDWRDDNQDKNTPELLTNRIFKVYLDYDIKSVQLASPDFNNGIPLNLNYEVGEDESGIFISFILPTLEYWDMIIIEK